jgi:peptidoglycan/LPS O-acetylase OafA/YrhL
MAAEAAVTRTPAPVVHEAPVRLERQRLSGLDGIRGVAALFVVLHHCYLVSFAGYPEATGPDWADWLIYGQLAVAVFIVLSGFSLAVSPARSGWELGSKRRFAVRRAWRILPPYWAALAFSLVVAWTIVPQPGESAPTAKSVAVNGLLVQDVFGAPTPNGAFWSIAIEAQLYIVFPLLLLLVRRAGVLTMVGAVATVAVGVELLSGVVPYVDELQRFTPQFAVLFAMGVAAAGVLVAQGALRQVPWHWLAALAAAPMVIAIAALGSVWTTGHFFWVDVALGPAIAMLLAAVATGRPRPLVRLLHTRPMRSLGSFSYSLYLIHAPIVVVVAEKVVAGRVTPGVPAFLAVLGIAVPCSIVAARLFAMVFEIPFQRHRGWKAVWAVARARLPQRAAA